MSGETAGLECVFTRLFLQVTFALFQPLQFHSPYSNSLPTAFTLPFSTKWLHIPFEILTQNHILPCFCLVFGHLLTCVVPESRHRQRKSWLGSHPIIQTLSQQTPKGEKIANIYRGHSWKKEILEPEYLTVRASLSPTYFPVFLCSQFLP